MIRPDAQLTAGQRCSRRRRRLSGGEARVTSDGRWSRERRGGAEAGRPQTTGMSDNG